jgi:dihydrodipicolinate synthase/N-acetylneuraminate lyase
LSGHPIVSTGDKTTEEKSKKVEEKACLIPAICYNIPSYERYNENQKEVPECHL